jgi:hypothetical protein
MEQLSPKEKALIEKIYVWIDKCKEQALIFNKAGMESSESCSMAMAAAYTNVKNELEKM